MEITLRNPVCKRKRRKCPKPTVYLSYVRRYIRRSLRDLGLPTDVEIACPSSNEEEMVSGSEGEVVLQAGHGGARVSAVTRTSLLAEQDGVENSV